MGLKWKQNLPVISSPAAAGAPSPHPPIKGSTLVLLNTQAFSSMRGHKQIMDDVLIGLGGVFFNHKHSNYGCEKTILFLNNPNYLATTPTHRFFMAKEGGFSPAPFSTQEMHVLWEQHQPPLSEDLVRVVTSVILSTRLSLHPPYTLLVERPPFSAPDSATSRSHNLSLASSSQLDK